MAHGTITQRCAVQVASNRFAVLSFGGVPPCFPSLPSLLPTRPTGSAIPFPTSGLLRTSSSSGPHSSATPPSLRHVIRPATRTAPCCRSARAVQPVQRIAPQCAEVVPIEVPAEKSQQDLLPGPRVQRDLPCRPRLVAQARSRRQRVISAPECVCPDPRILDPRQTLAQLCFPGIPYDAPPMNTGLFSTRFALFSCPPTCPQSICPSHAHPIPEPELRDAPHLKLLGPHRVLTHAPVDPRVLLPMLRVRTELETLARARGGAARHPRANHESRA